MVLVKKLASVVSIVFGVSLVLAAAAAAAGPGGGLGPGVFTFTDKEAVATFGTLRGSPPGQQGFSVIVDRGMNAFRTKGSEGTRTVANTTIVSLDIFDDAGNATFGCFVINPVDFAVSRDLQSASLHTTLTGDEICPGFGSPVTAGAASPFAGAGGGGAGLPLPITLDIVWNGSGVTSTGADHSTTRCLDYSTDFNSAIRSSNGGAAGTISSISGSIQTQMATVSSTDVTAAIKGIPQNACILQ
jgi:hypothetical protein